jgi:hypothetical protein
MPEFNSPNFKKTVPAAGQRQLREFTVGAPEDYPQEFPAEQAHQSFVSQREMSREELMDIEQNVKEARREKQSTMNKITDHAKRRTEILANIGRITKDVPLEGYTFSLRTLKAKETREAALQTFNVPTQLEANFEARRQQLARSIFKIDGHELIDVLGNDSIEAKLAFLDDLEESVIVKLFDEFSALKEESRVKFGITTEAEAKEVAEDLKK